MPQSPHSWLGPTPPGSENTSRLRREGAPNSLGHGAGLVTGAMKAPDTAQRAKARPEAWEQGLGEQGAVFRVLGMGIVLAGLGASVD